MTEPANEPRATHWTHAVRCGAIALFAFLGAASAIALLAPVPDHHDLSLKVAYLIEHADQYDALAVGSSRVYRSIVPRAVEQALAQRGERLRLYNLGFPGAEPYEADYYLRRALAARDSWRLVLVEAWRDVPDPEAEADDQDSPGFTRRRVHWHVPAHALDAIRACSSRAAWPVARRIAEAARHARGFGLRLTSFGRGVEIASALATDVPTEDFAWIARGDGYRALEEDPLTRGFSRRKQYLTDTDSVRRTALELERDLAGEPDSDGLDLDLVREQVRAVESKGATAVVLVAPGNPSAVSLHALAGVAPHVLSYQSPQAHPFLHDPALRFDANHLVHDAAVRFSVVLGRDLAEILATARTLRAED